ncbi:hypothetical protein [Pseudidiomarina sp.]|uniref:hypothetical protein n=1 Tax=Pseudidiomarina sp. TaxID=2081707 RepID=UPI003A96A4F7
MALLRFGIVSVIFSLLWLAPRAEISAVDGYHLEQTAVELNVSSERNSLDEPDYALLTHANPFQSTHSHQLEIGTAVAAFSYIVSSNQARAPPILD